jgi:NAD(P)-dependent dehydrogenase (short-subunit alcohol dehydrogenase family)
MSPLSEAREGNAAFSHSYLPVAIFVGGTSGIGLTFPSFMYTQVYSLYCCVYIGQAIAETFARYTKGNAHIIIGGRNETAANTIIATFPRPTRTGALHEFVYCDALLMKNVDSTTTDLLKRLPKINFLVLTPGFLTLKGRTEMEEGIDRKLALNYYARWKFIKDLMPLLRKAKGIISDLISWFSSRT